MTNPTIRVEDDGTMTLDWPESCGPTAEVSREVLEQITESLNELNEWRAGKRKSFLVPVVKFDPAELLRRQHPNPQQEVNP